MKYFKIYKLCILALISLWSLLFAALQPAMADSFGPLKGVTYGSGNNAVVVVLHGDMSNGKNPTYHYSFAKTVAKNKGTTAIALLRPGYGDGKQTSKGSTNNRRDHYTKANNDLVAKALISIKKTYKPRKLIVVGHSGGAAQLGAVIGRYPGIANSAVLVSGPFNISKWRATRNSDWPRSQSPHKYLKNVPKSTRIIAITGTSDTNTQPKLAKDYITKAKALGLSAQYIPIAGASHSFRKLSPRAAAVVKSEIKR